MGRAGLVMTYKRQEQWNFIFTTNSDGVMTVCTG